MSNEPAENSAAHRCGACGAPATWDPAAGGLRCRHCGHITSVAAGAAESVPQHEIHRALERGSRHGLLKEVRRVRCGTCGATVDFDPGAIAGDCAFCGASNVVGVTGQETLWPPEGILPFNVPQGSAEEAYRAWLGGLWFRPGDLQKRARLQSMKGVYVPFWSYDADVNTNWHAEAGYEETYIGADGKQHVRIEWRPVRDTHHEAYKHVLVYASAGLPEAMCQAIEPFDTENLAPYEPAYVTGFGAEEYRWDAAAAWVAAEERIGKLERKAVLELLPGHESRRLTLESSFDDVNFRHLLLPVWISAYRYKGRSYRFLVNGRTGAVHGKAPWSWPKIVATAAVVLGLVGALGGWWWQQVRLEQAEEAARVERSQEASPIRRWGE